MAIVGLAGRGRRRQPPSEREHVARYCERRGIAEVPNPTSTLAFCPFRLAGIFHAASARA